MLFVLTFLGAEAWGVNNTLPFVHNGNYAALPGKWLGDDSGGNTGAQPSTDGRRDLDLNTDNSIQGKIGDNIMLQICDGRSDCDAVCDSPLRYLSSMIVFFKRDSDKTAFIHVNRCTDGVTGTTAIAPVSGGQYKRCVGTYAAPIATAAFQLPPFLCEEACDKDLTCAMYTIDKSNQNCWLSKFTPNTDFYLYVKVPDAMRSS